MIPPVATYRLQLREGVDFDAAAAFLPHLQALGISHLYLSPIFTAATGSTHGYDVTRPDRIDPALGGPEGFERLAEAARAAGIGLILDLVPNHTAFSVENPWLADVLRHGEGSRYARHFDIDWDAGKLVLPWLPQPFPALLEQGAVRREGERLRIGDLAVPLRPAVQAENLAALHEAQHWQLVHWERERDGVTHRRFFNITGLIGMRVEDPAVFDAMHALPVDLVRRGLVQGLRIDHVDGLADPAAYLDRLRAAVGEGVPIWVEKILTGDEALPDWPVQGTTGYEAGAMIARLLGDGAGVERLREAWVAQTGGPPRFHDTLLAAKAEVIRRDLAAELRQLIALARAAAEPIAEVDPGDEALREAFIALLTAFPRYRSYFSARHTPPDDLALMARVAEQAAEGLRSGETVELIARMITRPQTPAEAAVQTRFQQVTGALLAKAHEDTAGFRWTPYLAACEVGADPDRPTASAAEFARWARGQGGGLLLTSSHDTKRSEDARMRLVAMSHLPEAALALIAQAAALPAMAGVSPTTRWYLVQSALAIWDPGDRDLDPRLQAHLTKALREADQITSWTHPDTEAEAAAHAAAAALTAAWRHAPPEALARLLARGEALSLAQLALKLVLPGVPDIYRGCEGACLALTDPDNRRPVDLAHLRALPQDTGLSGRKARLLQIMLGLRRAHPRLFRDGAFHIEAGEGLTVRREGEAGRLKLWLPPAGQDAGPGNLWPGAQEPRPAPLSLDFHAAG